MRIPVHSPWLPGYIVVVQTILLILTMAGLFPDRHHMYIPKEIHTKLMAYGKTYGTKLSGPLRGEMRGWG